MNSTATLQGPASSAPVATGRTAEAMVADPRSHVTATPNHRLHSDVAALALTAAVAAGLGAPAPLIAGVVPALAGGLRLSRPVGAAAAARPLDELGSIGRGLFAASLVLAAVTGAATITALAVAATATIAVFIGRCWASSRRERALTANPARTLVIGTGMDAQALAAQLLEHPHLGMVPVGYLDSRPQPLDPTIDLPLLGQPSRLIHVARRHGIDRIIIDTSTVGEAELLEVVDQANQHGIEITVLPLLAKHISTNVAVSNVAGQTLLTYQPAARSTAALAAKRALDIVGAALLLVVGAPLLAAVAVAIKIDSAGPVLFVQRRVGLDGRHFSMLKFRSMVANAEEVLDLDANEADGPYFKQADDPRVTRVGRIIRKLSIDELPQLVNVLRGDMSLVGPRPALPHEVAEYPDWFLRRLAVKPGLTGLWQVSGRYLLTFGESTRYDTAYVDHWSLGLDLKLLARTVPVVLTGKGAA